MKVSSKTEIKLETFDKCILLCDNDAPLGSLFDFSCALKSFLVQKMNEAEQSQKPKEEEPPKE